MSPIIRRNTESYWIWWAARTPRFSRSNNPTCGSPDRRDGMGAARDLGYGKYFINAAGGAITDDHQYVISGRNIPSIDIINYDPESKTGFASYWHTQKIIWRI